MAFVFGFAEHPVIASLNRVLPSVVLAKPATERPVLPNIYQSPFVKFAE
jgi:hypothetical protein